MSCDDCAEILNHRAAAVKHFKFSPDCRSASCVECAARYGASDLADEEYSHSCGPVRVTKPNPSERILTVLDDDDAVEGELPKALAIRVRRGDALPLKSFKKLKNFVRSNLSTYGKSVTEEEILSVFRALKGVSKERGTRDE